MTTNIVFTSPGSKNGVRRLLLLGSGELGKELLIEAHRLGVETHAVARYKGAPASYVAQYNYVIDMTNEQELRKLINVVQPTYIVPEIEAINVETLLSLEEEGMNIVPSAKAIYYTMNRERIRRLASEKYKFLTSNYKFAKTYDEFTEAVKDIGFPCIVKPVMSSSGKGQSTIYEIEDTMRAWNKAHDECRGGCDKVIIERMVDFDYEITLMTVRHKNGVDFCSPIVHKQTDGDFSQSMQSSSFLTRNAERECKKISKMLVDELGGYGIFGIEFFIRKGTVYFNEMSPRPHDTAMLTTYTQNMSQFELHLRAIMQIPIPKIELLYPGISVPIIVHNEPLVDSNGRLIGRNNNTTKYDSNSSVDMSDIIELPEELFKIKNLYINIFGKPTANKRRRMGLVVYIAPTIGMVLNMFANKITPLISNYLS